MSKSKLRVEPFPISLRGRPYFYLTVLKSARRAMTSKEIADFNPKELESRRVKEALGKLVPHGLVIYIEESDSYAITPRGALMIECVVARSMGLSTPLDEPWRGPKAITLKKHPDRDRP